MNIQNLTSTQLRKAADLKDKIEALNTQLEQITGKSGAVAPVASSVAPKKRGRPRKNVAPVVVQAESEKPKRGPIFPTPKGRRQTEKHVGIELADLDPAVGTPIGDKGYFLYILTDASNWDYSDTTSLLFSIWRQPWAHSWLILESPEGRLECGHTGDLGETKPRFHAGVFKRIRDGHPDPIAYLWEMMSDGRFQIAAAVLIGAEIQFSRPIFGNDGDGGTKLRDCLFGSALPV